MAAVPAHNAKAENVLEQTAATQQEDARRVQDVDMTPAHAGTSAGAAKALAAFPIVAGLHGGQRVEWGTDVAEWPDHLFALNPDMRKLQIRDAKGQLISFENLMAESIRDPKNSMDRINEVKFRERFPLSVEATIGAPPPKNKAAPAHAAAADPDELSNSPVPMPAGKAPARSKDKAKQPPVKALPPQESFDKESSAWASWLNSSVWELRQEHNCETAQELCHILRSIYPGKAQEIQAKGVVIVHYGEPNPTWNRLLRNIHPDGRFLSIVDANGQSISHADLMDEAIGNMTSAFKARFPLQVRRLEKPIEVANPPVKPPPPPRPEITPLHNQLPCHAAAAAIVMPPPPPITEDMKKRIEAKKEAGKATAKKAKPPPPPLHPQAAAAASAESEQPGATQDPGTRQDGDQGIDIWNLLSSRSGTTMQDEIEELKGRLDPHGAPNGIPMDRNRTMLRKTHNVGIKSFHDKAVQHIWKQGNLASNEYSVKSHIMVQEGLRFQMTIKAGPDMVAFKDYDRRGRTESPYDMAHACWEVIQRYEQSWKEAHPGVDEDACPGFLYTTYPADAHAGKHDTWIERFDAYLRVAPKEAPDEYRQLVEYLVNHQSTRTLQQNKKIIEEWKRQNGWALDKHGRISDRGRQQGTKPPTWNHTVQRLLNDMGSSKPDGKEHPQQHRKWSETLRAPDGTLGQVMLGDLVFNETLVARYRANQGQADDRWNERTKGPPQFFVDKECIANTSMWMEKDSYLEGIHRWNPSIAQCQMFLEAILQNNVPPGMDIGTRKDAPEPISAWVTDQQEIRRKYQDREIDERNDWFYPSEAPGWVKKSWRTCQECKTGYDFWQWPQDTCNRCFAEKSYQCETAVWKTAMSRDGVYNCQRCDKNYTVHRPDYKIRENPHVYAYPLCKVHARRASMELNEQYRHYLRELEEAKKRGCNLQPATRATAPAESSSPPSGETQQVAPEQRQGWWKQASDEREQEHLDSKARNQPPTRGPLGAEEQKTRPWTGPYNDDGAGQHKSASANAGAGTANIRQRSQPARSRAQSKPREVPTRERSPTSPTNSAPATPDAPPSPRLHPDWAAEFGNRAMKTLQEYKDHFGDEVGLHRWIAGCADAKQRNEGLGRQRTDANAYQPRHFLCRGPVTEPEKSQSGLQGGSASGHSTKHANEARGPASADDGPKSPRDPDTDGIQRTIQVVVSPASEEEEDKAPAPTTKKKWKDYSPGERRDEERELKRNYRLQWMSRHLSWATRHGHNNGLVVDANGWISCTDIFQTKQCRDALRNNSWEHYNSHEIQYIVEFNDKKRFEFKSTSHGDYIRANQGHSYDNVVRLDSHKPLQLRDLPKWVIHGTSIENLESLMQWGIRNSAGRNDIHFQPYLPEDRAFRRRHKDTMLVWVRTKEAFDMGITFFLSENDAVLSPGLEGVIPPELIAKTTRSGALPTDSNYHIKLSPEYSGQDNRDVAVTQSSPRVIRATPVEGMSSRTQGGDQRRRTRHPNDPRAGTRRQANDEGGSARRGEGRKAPRHQSPNRPHGRRNARLTPRQPNPIMHRLSPRQEARGVNTAERQARERAATAFARRNSQSNRSRSQRWGRQRLEPRAQQAGHTAAMHREHAWDVE